MKSARSVMCPACYHGFGQRPPYFEGWYFKVVDASEQHRYAIIPGVSLGGTGSTKDAHSFVQVLDGISGATSYVRYPLEEFWAARNVFEIRIGPNRFSERELVLDLPDDSLGLKGQLVLDELRPWPVTLASPGIMGWFSWVPRMECYHGVLSLDHGLHGSLQISGQGIVAFDGGRGYIEKDWGQAFPTGWVWMQSNHFDTPGTCLTASIAMIPWIGRAFRGFIVGLYLRGKLYRFATYTGAKTDVLEINADSVHWSLHDRLYQLDIVASRAAAGDLRGPSHQDMGRRVPETLQARVAVRLKARHKGAVLFDETGRVGGLEVAGDLATLEGA